jgi:hypothetical protein
MKLHRDWRKEQESFIDMFRQKCITRISRLGEVAKLKKPRFILPVFTSLVRLPQLAQFASRRRLIARSARVMRHPLSFAPSV